MSSQVVPKVDIARADSTSQDDWENHAIGRGCLLGLAIGIAWCVALNGALLYLATGLLWSLFALGVGICHHGAKAVLWPLTGGGRPFANPLALVPFSVVFPAYALLLLKGAITGEYHPSCEGLCPPDAPPILDLVDGQRVCVCVRPAVRFLPGEDPSSPP